MANIYQIQQDLLAIFDELEENGGELTSELEEKLTITQESFKDKVESYTKVIASFNVDLNAIKEETNRLNELKKRKEKTLERMKKVVIEAIEQFGDEKKSGVKYLDYGTGQVSVRNTQAVQLYDDNIKHIVECLNYMIDVQEENNQLDVIDKVDCDTLIDLCASFPMGDTAVGINVSKEDLQHIQLKLTSDITLDDVLHGKGWNAIKEVVKYSPYYELKANVSKSTLKDELKVNGACAPKIGKLVTNKSLTIR